MLLHENMSSDAIRNFFQDVYELYIKVSYCYCFSARRNSLHAVQKKTLLNPFYEVNAKISSIGFDAKVRLLAKKHLI